MQVQVQLLTSAHDRANFRCGEVDLDRWLETQALQQQSKNTSRTFVLVDEANPEAVLGFYALTISQADGTAVPSKRSLPQVVPVIRLGRLAIREDLQGKGFRLGEILLLNAIERVVEISNLGSGVALVVDAKHDKAASFYRKYGFRASPDSPLMLYLPISVCRELVMAP